MTKFDNKITEQLNAIALDGFADEEFGSVSENGIWTALLIGTEIKDAEHAIMFEDDQGFVWSHIYKTEKDARSDFDYNLKVYEQIFSPEASLA